MTHAIELRLTANGSNAPEKMEGLSYFMSMKSPDTFMPRIRHYLLFSVLILCMGYYFFKIKTQVVVEMTAPCTQQEMFYQEQI